MSLGCGRKWESPEKIHVDMEGTGKLHTDSGSSQESFFFLINVTMK